MSSSCKNYVPKTGEHDSEIATVRLMSSVSRTCGSTILLEKFRDLSTAKIPLKRRRISFKTNSLDITIKKSSTCSSSSYFCPSLLLPLSGWLYKTQWQGEATSSKNFPNLKLLRSTDINLQRRRNQNLLQPDTPNLLTTPGFKTVTNSLNFLYSWKQKKSNKFK